MDDISTLILGISLMIIMLGMGLSLVVSDFKNIFRFPKAILIGLTNQLILLPLIGFAVVLLFPMQPEIAIGVMILASCPGGATSNLISFMAKADLALSVSLTAFSSLITVFTIPFITNFALDYFSTGGKIIELNVLETITQIFSIVVIPIVLGMLIRYFRPNFANKMGKPVRIASGAILALIIIGIVIKEKANIGNYMQQAGLATLILNVSSMVVGYFSAKIFKLKQSQALSIAIESGIQNGTLAITIAVVILGNTTFAIAPSVYSLFMFLTGGIVIFFSLRRNEKTIS